MSMSMSMAQNAQSNPSQATIHGPVVHIPGLGSIKGTVKEQGTSYSFLKVPYSEPPVGSSRWQPPKVHGPWGSDVRDGTQFGDVCMQPTANASLTQSEDCLFLNIYTPNVNASKLPVMFWIVSAEKHKCTSLFPSLKA